MDQLVPAAWADLLPTPAVGDAHAAPIRAWLDTKAGRTGSAKTARAYTDTLASFRAALQAAGLDLDSAVPSVALAAQLWAAAGNPAAATYNQRLAIVSSFYVFAERRSWLTSGNPLRLVERRPVQAYASAAPLSPVLVQQRLAAIDRSDRAGLRDYALLAVFLQTGRRLAEVAALQWGDVVSLQGRCTLVFQRAKGAKVLRDTLPHTTSAALLAWLQAYYGAGLAEVPPLAPLWVSLSPNGTAGQPLSTRTIARIAEARLGTSKVHALRHTFAWAMEEAGAKVSDIQRRLGHASLSTTGHYLAALRAADNPHGEALEALFGVRTGASPPDDRTAYAGE